MIHPVLIEPDAIYDDGALRQSLGLTDATLAAARRSGALKSTRKGKRTLYRGSWVLAWLDSDASRRAEEARPRQPDAGREGGL